MLDQFPTKCNLAVSGETGQTTRIAETPPYTPREWLGLRELSVYANVSERTLRTWIRFQREPLPATRIRGKVLVRRVDFDRFLEKHRVQPLEAVNVDRIIDEVLGQQR